MAKLIIDRGTADDDGTGDTLSEWANKTNANADQLYAGAMWFAFISRTTSAEPGAPTDSDCYLLPGSGVTGTNWAGNDGKIAIYSDTYDRSTGGWFFITVVEGMAGWVQDDNENIIRNGTGWFGPVPVSLSSTSNSTAVDLDTGINFNLTLDEDSQIANPTNAKPGQSGRIRVIDDGTGGWDLTFAGYWNFIEVDGSLTTNNFHAYIYAYFVNTATDIEISYVGGMLDTGST